MNITLPAVGTDEKQVIDIASTMLGRISVLTIPVRIAVEAQSFLHVGASPSPLSEKKCSVFKIDRTPVIPASSFKGALRHQLELLLSAEYKTLAQVLNLSGQDQELLKPCVPAPRPSDAEHDLIRSKQYRGIYCSIQVGENKTQIDDDGLCPVCYFMGAAGIMGCVRVPNFFPQAHQGAIVVDQTNIRLDRKTGTAVDKAKVDTEQVKPGTEFVGVLEVVESSPLGFKLGQSRIIAGKTVDPWLNKWQETDLAKRQQLLLERILLPALYNVRKLGGQKSKGGGNVLVTVQA